MGVFISIDYGSKKTGLATTDTNKIIASALATVKTKEAISYLKKFNQQNPIDKFIIGEPKQKDGSPSIVESEIATFINLLNLSFPSISIERYDERYTSKIALNFIKQSGINKQKRKNKSLIDRISATIILQSYLESKNNKS
ncbi:MAG: Holliday junction resolvase RuvX [Flavobacteriaceae bacterium]|nr:Holliday junction resolvase RuvX [Flavobacteriaceae bacterium]|tara:strand:+ start:6393 stop:6815 length:423 start_codon:yes stop_codon:yes gene_type:complete